MASPERAAVHAEIRRTTRRAVWRWNAVLVPVGLLTVLLFGFGLSVMGDPGPPPDPGTIEITIAWETDGYVSAVIDDAYREQVDHVRIAGAIAPALFAAGTPTVMEQVERFGGVRVRSTEPVLARDEALTLDTEHLVAAMGTVDIREADLEIRTALVDLDVVADPPADYERAGRVSWDAISADRHPTIAVSRNPNPGPAIAQQAISGAVGVALVLAAIGVSRRARRALWDEDAVLHWCFALLGVAGLVAYVQLFGALRFDEIVARWPLPSSVHFVAQWTPVALSLFAGVWCACAVVASLVRRNALMATRTR